MHQLDPDATRPLVDAALEEGSKDVKLAAMRAWKVEPMRSSSCWSR